MGLKYANITLQTADQKKVIAFLNNIQRMAFVLPLTKGFVMVCDEISDLYDPDTAQQLTQYLGCSGILVVNFDDDILLYWLYQSGQLLDEYNSHPDYSEENSTTPLQPTGGNARILCEAFNKTDYFSKVDKILHPEDDSSYLDENNRHSDLANLLGWPTQYSHLGYDELVRAYNENSEPPIFAKIVTRKWLKQFYEPDRRIPKFDLDKELRKLLRQNRKISAMTLYQQYKLCSLADARNYIEEMEKH